MTLATISHWQFKLQTLASPITLQSIEEVVSVAGIGTTSPTVDVTNFDSPAGTKEYIAGLAEGSEFTVECNYIPSGSNKQKLAMDAADAKVNRSFSLIYTGSSPNRSFTGTVACQGWEIVPSATSQNLLRLNYKITGNIVRV